MLDPAGDSPLTSLYAQLTGEPTDFRVVVDEAKRFVVEHGLHAEVARLVEVAASICHDHLELRDHTRRGLRECIVELLVAIPVYRAYVVPGEPAPTGSRGILDQAAAAARERLPEDRHGTLNLLVELALGDWGRGAHRDEFVVRFQQTCAPVMAKGVEDTAFYRWFRLSGLNEVGGDPQRLGVSVEEFHEWCRRTQDAWPDAMTTLSTHDTKRSEDVRARLALLSELPAEWAGRVTSWRADTGPDRPAVLDPNTEYLMWQTLLGAWPIDLDRLGCYLEKATREAKRRTSWTQPDEEYDAAVRAFAGHVLTSEPVIGDLAAFIERLAPHFRVNVLTQKLLSLTMPGVPDVYQGCELVDLSLVDPDNRRPVDYADRAARLERLDRGQPPRDLDDEKLLVVSCALRLRREHPTWFGANSAYEPLVATSPHVVAFARGRRTVTVAGRLHAGLRDGWGDGALLLPPGGWRDALTGRTYAGEQRLDALLATLPVALLVLEEDGPDER